MSKKMQKKSPRSGVMEECSKKKAAGFSNWQKKDNEQKKQLHSGGSVKKH